MASQPRPGASPARRQAASWGGSEEEWLAALKARDSRAMGVLFDRFEGMVNRLVWRFLGADVEHDDLVRQVFLKALEEVGSVRKAPRLESWMTSLTVNTVRRELRRRRLRRLLGLTPAHDDAAELEEAKGPVAVPDDFEAREALRRTYVALGTLPSDEQIAFVLRHLDGQSLEEAAEACGCSLATLKRRLSRAEQRFCAAAEEDPLLAERLARGERWGEP